MTARKPIIGYGSRRRGSQAGRGLHFRKQESSINDLTDLIDKMVSAQRPPATRSQPAEAVNKG
jgi:hypothetical protein